MGQEDYEEGEEGWTRIEMGIRERKREMLKLKKGKRKQKEEKHIKGKQRKERKLNWDSKKK